MFYRGDHDGDTLVAEPSESGETYGWHRCEWSTPLPDCQDTTRITRPFALWASRPDRPLLRGH